MGRFAFQQVRRRSGGGPQWEGNMEQSPPPQRNQRMQTVIQFGIGSIQSTSGGFARLGSLHRDLSAFSNADITIDLSKLYWFDGHMAAPLRLVVRHAEARGNSISYISPSSAVETLLRKNGFLS